MSPAIREFIAIVLSVYLGAVVSGIGTSILSDGLSMDRVGNILFYIGVAVLIVGFLILGAKGDKYSGASKSPHMQSDAQFKEWRNRERPAEFNALALILAGALVIGTGYLLF